MKVLLQTINATPGFARLFDWGKLVTVTGFSQILIQAVGFVCGILVIRLLPTSEYALYTLANTMLGTMAVLADGGISTGVISQGGRVWQDRAKLGTVIATGFHMTRRFGVVSVLVAIPAMLFLMRYHNAQWLTCALIVMALVPAFFSTLSSSLLQIAPRLQQDITRLQKNQVSSNFIRLGLLCTTLVFMPLAFVAIMASSLSQIWANARLRKICAPYADYKQDPDVHIKAEITTFVKRLLPGSIYYCLSGQVTIWLISVFGTTAAIAQVGALARLTMVLTIFSIITSTLIIPRFARLVDQGKILMDWYINIQVFLLLFTIVVVAGVWLFSDEILWVLGENYQGLNHELVLSIMGGCLNLAVGISFTMNSSRGWLLHPAIGICIGIAGIIGGVMLLDVSTLRGVLLFNIFTGVVGLLIHPLFGFLKIAKVVR